MRWLSLDVPIEHPDFGRAFPCQCAQTQEEQRRLERLQRYSNLGALTRCTFDRLLPTGLRPDAESQQAFQKTLEASLAYARQPRGWLVLLGPSGTGKTHLAAAIANEVLQRGEHAFFVVVPDLLDHLRAAFSPGSETPYDELFEQVRSAPLLLLDDLGAQSSTPWAEEKLFQVLNHRFNAELPTLVTTRVPMDKLDEALRSRLTDPLLSQVCLTAVSAPVQGHLLEGTDLPRLKAMTLEGFDRDRADVTEKERESLRYAHRAASAYAETPEGWLVLMGAHGSGKTHLAASVANSLRAQGEPVLFVVVPEFLDHLRAAFAPDSPVGYDEIFEKVKKAPHLVLDDLGAHSSTPWAREKLYQLINYRYNAGLPLIVTTSWDLDTEEIDAHRREGLDPNLAARLWDIKNSHLVYIAARGYWEGKPAPRVSPDRGDASRRRR